MTQKYFFFKNHKSNQKTLNFPPDFEYVEKVVQKCKKKIISKISLTKRAYFRHVFPNNFFWCIFSKLFQRIQNQQEILRSWFPYWIFFALISTFCKLWLHMRRKRLKKRKIFFYKCVLELLGNHQRVCITKLLKSLYRTGHTLTWNLKVWTLGCTTRHMVDRGMYAPLSDR